MPLLALVAGLSAPAMAGTAGPPGHLFGDDVVTLWRTSGPRKSHTDEVACILAEIGDYPRKVVIQSFTSGAFKVFAEVAGKTPDQMTDALIEQYAPA